MPTGKLAGCFFDIEANKIDLAELSRDKKAVRYTGTNESGRTGYYTLPCGSPILIGATCTCNNVRGTYSPHSYSPSSGGGSYRVCTCVPVCQDYKILDPDPTIRIMAEESLLLMSRAEFDYMRWAGSTSSLAVQVRNQEIMEQIQNGM